MERANSCLSNLNDWFIADKLNLSLDKTCYTVFPASKKEGNTISLDQTNLNHVYGFKYLGVTIDADLKWTIHIDNVFNKLTRYVGIFYKLRRILPVHCLKSLFYALVHSNLLYDVEIYGNVYSM